MIITTDNQKNSLLFKGDFTIDSLSSNGKNQELMELRRYIDKSHANFNKIDLVDLTKVNQIDSLAVVVLLKLTIANKVKLKLLNPSKDLLNLIELYNLKEHFEILIKANNS